MSHHCYLTKQGYLVKKDQVDEPTLKEIRKDLTVSPIVFQAYQDFVKPVKFEIFQESPNYVYLPRYYGVEKFGPPRKDMMPDGLPINLSFRYDLRPHQITAYGNTLKRPEGEGWWCSPNLLRCGQDGHGDQDDHRVGAEGVDYHQQSSSSWINGSSRFISLLVHMLKLGSFNRTSVRSRE